MQADLSENRRIIAIGDIHGCLFSLKKLIEKLNIEPGEQIVFLGDLIDRGPRSKEVVEYVIGLSVQYSCHYIMGNHELMYLNYLDNRDVNNWVLCGGLATLKSYNSTDGRNIAQEHLAFFRNAKFFLETESYLFTHGGLDPELSIQDNLRYYKPEEFCWQQVHMRQSFRDSNNYNWKKTVVCAHTAVTEPVLLDKLIAIDTGCVYKESPKMGKLTAVILPERTTVQIENCD
ncbi:MAG: metallophosphoesterase family protein [Chlorobium sp.]